MTTIFEEIAHVPALAHSGCALVEFARDLGRVTLHPEGRRWVARPHNFVTFTVQASRNQDIVVTLRGEPPEFEIQPDLRLRPDRKGYSRFNFSEPKQLHAAATYIKRAFELYERGPGRPHKRPRTVEV